MSNKGVPSAEDFARAKAAMRKNDEGLSEVRSRLLSDFGGRGVHELFVLFSPSADCFGIYVFFGRSAQVEEAKRSGLSREIEVAALDALERAGRGQGSSLNVSFEFDSHENVERNFDGSYFDRLR